MSNRAAFASLLLVACASQQTARAPFSVDALVANAPTYVASRYEARELPAALVADLTAVEFQCQHSAAVSECWRSQHTFASCWDVVTVHIAADAPARAERNRRCMGANPPGGN